MSDRDRLPLLPSAGPDGGTAMAASVAERWPERGDDGPSLWITLSAAAIAIHGIDAWVLRPERDRGLLARGLTLAIIATLWTRMVSLWRRSGPRRRGALAAALGSAALVAGIAITTFHIREFGLIGQHWSGLVSTVAGVVLLAAATSMIVGSYDSRWRWPVGLAAAALVVAYVLTPVTVALYVTNAPRPRLGSMTPADVGLAYEDVDVRTDDGLRLAAWYVPSRNGAAVLLLHGSAEARDVMLGHAEVLASHGYGALLLDARGHGQSEGTAMEWGWHAEDDVDAAVTYLRSRPDVAPDRIAALGLSMGAHTALTAAAADPRIAAVVAEGASARSFEDVLPIAGLPAIPGWWLQFTLADLISEASPPIPLQDAMRFIAPRPVLLIAGREPRELRANRDYAEAGGASTALWSLPHAPHARALPADPRSYETRVVGFLDEALGFGAASR